MLLHVDGLPSQFHIDTASEAVAYIAKKIIPKDIRDELSITIEPDHDLDHYGLCVNDDMFDESGELFLLPDKSRNFTIYLQNNDTVEDMLSTLIHEIVHIKQYALNEMTYDPTPSLTIEGEEDLIPVWHGIQWKPKRGEHANWDAPWEIEAYGKAVGLYIQFMNYWNRKFGTNLGYLEARP